MRCRDCEGCRRYELLLLRRRLAAHYQEADVKIWLVIVECHLPNQTSLLARVRRSGGADYEPGFVRLGTSTVALIARGPRPRPRAPHILRSCGTRVKRVRAPSRMGSWRALRSSTMTARIEYGPQVKRWYIAGLAKLARETFIVERRGGIRKRHPDAKQGVLAWSSGFSLYPSLRAQGAHLLALIIKRDGHLDGRKCTHKKCTSERCRYEYRQQAPGTYFNGAPRASAASVPQMTEIRNAERPRLLKINSNIITGDRDASSQPVGELRDPFFRAVMDKIQRRMRGEDP